MARQFGIRSRILAVAAAILVVTLATWLWVLVEVFDSTLAATARKHAELQAMQLASQLADPAAVDEPFPTSNEVEDVVLQVLDSDGRLLQTSDPAADQPITTMLPAPGKVRSARVAQIPGVDRSAFVIVAEGVTTADGAHVVAVVANPVHVEEDVLTRLLIQGGVAGLFVLGVATVLVRWAVGAAFTPVERMRGRLAAIDGRTIGDRVEVPETGDELTLLGNTMNDMLARLEAAYAAQRAFVSDASHELRSPLATVRTAVELASADPTGRVWQQTHETLHAEILRLQALVDDLLVLSRYDAGGLPLRQRECDLDDLVIEAALRTRAESGLNVSVRAEPARVVADSDRLTQVLRNLLDNAVRHAKSAIRAGLELQADRAIVTIDNDGPPVPEDKREDIFERFVRLDVPRDRDSGGSGLGLAIAADLVRAHEGQLTTTETADGWCRFEFSLPLLEPPAA